MTERHRLVQLLPQIQHDIAVAEKRCQAGIEDVMRTHGCFKSSEVSMNSQQKSSQNTDGYFEQRWNKESCRKSTSFFDGMSGFYLWDWWIRGMVRPYFSMFLYSEILYDLARRIVLWSTELAWILIDPYTCHIHVFFPGSICLKGSLTVIACKICVSHHLEVGRFVEGTSGGRWCGTSTGARFKTSQGGHRSGGRKVKRCLHWKFGGFDVELGT